MSRGNRRFLGVLHKEAVLIPKLNHKKGDMNFPLSTKVKLNPKLVIMILSVFIVWE
jgi:hypothetical protein